MASAALAGAALPALGVFAGPAAAVSDPNCTTVTTVVTCVFTYNGSTNVNGTAISWPVPDGVTSLNIIANGADGGASTGGGAGGDGGQVKATLTGIPASTTLSIFPGGKGGTTALGGINQSAAVPGLGGGGASGLGDTTNGGSGGGASTIAVTPLGSTPFSNLLVVAGGGGGGSVALPGGNGGTSKHPAGDGGQSSGSATGGGGGTVMGGGAAGQSAIGCFVPALAGGKLKGGLGGGVLLTQTCANGGGGGGSGYYGGGGGGGGYGAGGGGSAYPASTTTVGGITVTPDTHDSYVWPGGNGKVTLSYDLISTTTTLTSSVNPSVPSGPVTFTAVVSPSDGSGTVAFDYDGSTIGTCSAQTLSLVDGSYQATCTTSSLPQGSDSVTATYNPSDNSAYESSYDTITQVVVTTTSTSLTSSLNPSDYGQSVTLTATVSPTDGGGSVDFENGGASIAGCDSQPLSLVDGSYVATCTTSALPGGTDVLTAVYSGDDDYSTSTSDPLDQVVNAGPSHLRAWLTVTPAGGFILQAQLTSGGVGISGQTITFRAGHNGTLLCTKTTGNQGTASCVLTRSQSRELERTFGAFTASYAGSGSYGPASAYYPGIWF